MNIAEQMRNIANTKNQELKKYYDNKAPLIYSWILRKVEKFAKKGKYRLYVSLSWRHDYIIDALISFLLRDGFKVESSGSRRNIYNPDKFGDGSYYDFENNSKYIIITWG